MKTINFLLGLIICIYSIGEGLAIGTLLGFIIWSINIPNNLFDSRILYLCLTFIFFMIVVIWFFEQHLEHFRKKPSFILNYWRYQ